MLLRAFPFSLAAEIAISAKYFQQIVAPWCNSDSVEDSTARCAENFNKSLSSSDTFHGGV
jgi:hypothetical protein